MTEAGENPTKTIALGTVAPAAPPTAEGRERNARGQLTAAPQSETVSDAGAHSPAEQREAEKLRAINRAPEPAQEPKAGPGRGHEKRSEETSEGFRDHAAEREAGALRAINRAPEPAQDLFRRDRPENWCRPHTRAGATRRGWHPIRPTDKRRAVETLLRDPEGEWSEWSDQVIALKCGVARTFVFKVIRRRRKTPVFPGCRRWRHPRFHGVLHAAAKFGCGGRKPTWPGATLKRIPGKSSGGPAGANSPNFRRYPSQHASGTECGRSRLRWLATCIR